MGLEGHDKRQKNNNLIKYGVPSWKPINWQCNVCLMFFNFNPDFILWSFSIYTFCLSFPICRPVSFCTQRSTKRGLTSSASSTFTHQTLLRWVDNGVKGGDSGDGRDDGDDLIVLLHTPNVAIHLSTPNLYWVGLGICHCCHMLLCWSILMFWSWWLWWWRWWWSLMEW